jgi:hypothetical protein
LGRIAGPGLMLIPMKDLTRFRCQINVGNRAAFPLASPREIRNLQWPLGKKFLLRAVMHKNPPQMPLARFQLNNTVEGKLGLLKRLASRETRAANQFKRWPNSPSVLHFNG